MQFLMPSLTNITVAGLCEQESSHACLGVNLL